MYVLIAIILHLSQICTYKYHTDFQKYFHLCQARPSKTLCLVPLSTYNLSCLIQYPVPPFQLSSGAFCIFMLSEILTRKKHNNLFVRKKERNMCNHFKTVISIGYFHIDVNLRLHTTIVIPYKCLKHPNHTLLLKENNESRAQIL